MKAKHLSLLASIAFASQLLAGVTIRVAPPQDPALPDGDGLSWETPYYSINNAANEVSRLGGGSILLKKGLYEITEPIIPQNNITIVGGFSGEESSDEITAPVNPLETIISGDVRHSLSWYSTLGTMGKVWDYETTPPTLTEPTPALTLEDKYWRPYVKNFTDATPYCISNSNPIASLSLKGITLTGFRLSCVFLRNGNGGTVSIDNCAFVANKTATGDGYRDIYAIDINEYGVSVADSLFLGNQHTMLINNPTVETLNTISDTEFKYNVVTSRQTKQVYFTGSSQNCKIQNCNFYRNSGLSNYGGTDVALTVEGASATVENCDYTENHSFSTSRSTLGISAVTSFVRNCNFSSNRYESQNGGWVQDCSATISAYGGNGSETKILIENSCFDSNHISVNYSSAVNAGKTHSAVYTGGKGSHVTFLNSTFKDNKAEVTVAPDLAITNNLGIFLSRQGYTSHSTLNFINCIIADSEITPDPLHCQGEFSAYHFSLVNSLVRNKAVDYSLWVTNNPAPANNQYKVEVINSVVSGLIDNPPTLADNQVTKIVNQIIRDEDPALRENIVTNGKTGTRAMAIKSTSPYRKSGINIWRGENGFPYVVLKSGRLASFPRLSEAGNSSSTPQNSQSLYGFSTTDNSDLIPDAFGALRKFDSYPIGPLNPASPAAILKVF